MQVGGASDKDKDGLDLGITPNRGGDGGGGHTGSGYLRLLPEEYGHKIHFNQSHYGTLSSGIGTPWGKDSKVVVGDVVLGHGRDTYTSLGGITGREGGRGLWVKYI